MAWAAEESGLEHPCQGACGSKEANGGFAEEWPLVGTKKRGQHVSRLLAPAKEMGWHVMKGNAAWLG